MVNIMILYLKIFLSRILDVSIGTIRTMYIVKGNRVISSILAFFEVFIWFYAARLAFKQGNNILIVICYSLGYATGTYIGTILNEIFITGVFKIEVISSKLTNKDILTIKKKGYGISVLKTVDSKIFFNISVRKKHYKDCIKLIRRLDNKAFISVTDSKLVLNGFIK